MTSLAAQWPPVPSQSSPVPTRLALLPATLAITALTACQTPADSSTTVMPETNHASLAAARGVAPQGCTDDPKWTDPTPPRHIFGNSWYVGTCGITAVLVTSPHGHVLIDTGPQDASDSVEANIRALGFKVDEIRIILNTHEHRDHAGGISRLQRDSGAKVLARAPAAEALSAGKSDRRDPQFGWSVPFPAVANVHTLADGADVTLGSLAIHNIPSPGHTAGGSSWRWRSCEGTTCRDIVFADSVTAISDKVYRYSDHPEHVAAFRDALANFQTQPCDILLTAHPDASNLINRLDGKAALVDGGACKAYALHGMKGLDQRLGDEAQGKQP